MGCDEKPSFTLRFVLIELPRRVIAFQCSPSHMSERFVCSGSQLPVGQESLGNFLSGSLSLSIHDISSACPIED